jgi:glycosyltransferase involved in cell wall biosynthesis
MAAADVYCQPNISGESFGLTFLEALSAHLPVVTTGIGGAQEILTPHCGVLVRPLDTSALAAALEQLISDASLRERLGAAGPAQVRHLGDVSAQLDALRHALLRVAA